MLHLVHSGCSALSSCIHWDMLGTCWISSPALTCVEQQPGSLSCISASCPPADLFMPLSELKALRRSAANRCLDALRQRPSSHGLSSAAVLPGMLRNLDNFSGNKALNSSHSPSTTLPEDSRRQLALGAPSQHVRTRLAQQEEASRTASCSSTHQQQRQQRQGQQALLRVLCRSMAQVQVTTFWRANMCQQHLHLHG